MKHLKLICLWLAGAASFYGMMNALRLSFEHGGGWWWVVVWGVVFSAMLALQIGFIARRGVLAGMLVLEGLVPLGVFYRSVLVDFSQWVLIGAGVCVLCFIFGAVRTRNTLDNTLAVQFFSAARVALPKIGLGLLLLCFALAYNHYVERGGFTRAVAERMVTSVLKQGEPLVQIMYSNLRFDMGMKQAIAVVSEAELRKIRTESLTQGESVSQLTPQEESAALRALGEEITKRIAALGGPVPADGTLRHYIFAALADRVELLPDIAKIALTGGFAVVLFISLRFALSLLYPVAGFIAFAVFKLLLLTSFVNVAQKDTKQQIIVL